MCHETLLQSPFVMTVRRIRFQLRVRGSCVCMEGYEPFILLIWRTEPGMVCYRLLQQILWLEGSYLYTLYPYWGSWTENALFASQNLEKHEKSTSEPRASDKLGSFESRDSSKPEVTARCSLKEEYMDKRGRFPWCICCLSSNNLSLKLFNSSMGRSREVNHRSSPQRC